MAKACALESGVVIADEPPVMSVAVLWKRRDGIYAGSVGVIEHGPLLMFEWLVLNPLVPHEVKHAAAERMMRAGKDYAAGMGKRPVLVVDKRRGGQGIRVLAERMGLAKRNEHLEVLEGEL